MRTPSLRLHRTGQWSTAWNGKTFYFGTDRNEAKSRYLDNLKDWSAWKADRRSAVQVQLKPGLLVGELVSKFLDSKEAEGGIDLRRYYAKHLARFNGVFQDTKASSIRPIQVQSFKTKLLGLDLKPKTINHDLVAAKAVLRWGSSLDLVAPVDLSGVKQIPLGPPPDKSLHEWEVLEMLRVAGPIIRPWLVVNYLTLARPIEVVRVVNGIGSWVEPGIFRVPSKNDRRTRQHRHLVFSDLALDWLSSCEPLWSRLDSYSSAVRKQCGAGGPHPLRHSAATHLAQRGVSRADIDLLLGHLPSRVSQTYNPIRLQPLRALTALLCL